LKNGVDKAKGTSSSGFTKKSFCYEINILAKEWPRNKILEMIVVVLQQEHKKLAAKSPKKAKKTKLILDESSNSSEYGMSIDHITVSKWTRSIVRPKKKRRKCMKTRCISP
jgi:hypothetical protein